MRRGRIGRARLAPVCAVAVLATAAAPAAATALPCNGNPRLCNRTLDRVVLPATHNSMSNAAAGWQIPNQQVGIPEQLAAGVRGFLIDTYYAHRDANGTLVTDTTPTPTSQLYLCHVACSIGATPLIDALRGIRRFLRDHPRNVLVFVNEDYTRPEDFARQVRLSGLRRHVFGGQLGSRWPTLRKLIARRRQVVMLSQGDTGSVRWYHNGYAGLLQETPYNWVTPDLLTEPGELAGELRPQPRRHDRRPVPDEPLVAAGGAQPGHLRDRQRDRHAGPARPGLPLRARPLADADRGRHVPERRPVRGRAPAELRDRLAQPNNCSHKGISAAAASAKVPTHPTHARRMAP